MCSFQYFLRIKLKFSSKLNVNGFKEKAAFIADMIKEVPQIFIGQKNLNLCQKFLLVLKSVRKA
jgi:hypothetical protein